MTVELKSTDDQENQYRYERKYVLSAADLSDLVLRIKLHPNGFREKYSPRYVNNMYFDTLGHTSFFDNVEGVGGRTKLRVRWYGDLVGEIKEPVLEFKVKRGVVGTKRRIHLPSFEMPEELAVGKSVVTALSNAELPPGVMLQQKFIQPTLLNRYRRRYFETAGGVFRLTIDSDLRYFDPRRRPAVIASAAANPEPQLIVELKYNEQQEPEAGGVANYLGLRVTKNSKYVRGLEQLTE